MILKLVKSGDRNKCYGFRLLALPNASITISQVERDRMLKDELFGKP